MKEWLHILRCPVTHEKLSMLQGEELQEKIGGNSALNIQLPPEKKKYSVELLCNESGTCTYLVVDGIPLLLPEMAISVGEGGSDNQVLSAEKKKVQGFYDTQGWTKPEGDYQDAVIYEDLRPVSADYIKKCHERVARHLPSSGKYLLDAASGAIQFDIYLTYSQNFDYRICVDFSLLALQEARKKLRNKGIYILCDITNLPFIDGVIDAFVSLNTIYHIPKEEQVKAVHELYRTLVPNGKGVVVYDWFKHSLWMNIALLPFRGFVFIKNRIVKAFSSAKKSHGRLYFFAHSLQYFREHLPPFKIFVWRTISVPFMKYYLHPALFGKAFLAWLYRYEERNPESCGKNGEYPMMVFEKKPN